MMVTTVFLFTFSCVLNRQCIHNLFWLNSTRQFNSIFVICNAPMRPVSFTRTPPWDLGLLSLLQCSLETWLSLAPNVLLGLRKHLKTRLKCVTIHFWQWRIKLQFLLNSRFGMITIWIWVAQWGFLCRQDDVNAKSEKNEALLLNTLT